MLTRLQRDALPHLQSLVIVLLRPILANVTAIVTQQPAQMPPGMAGRGNAPMTPGLNGGPAGQKPMDPAGMHPPPEAPELSPEDVDAARTREITAKAMTGILLLLLKWLRLSRKPEAFSGLGTITDMIYRRAEIRVLYPTPPGLKLRPARFEALCPPGHSTGSRQQDGPHRKQVRQKVSHNRRH